MRADLNIYPSVTEGMSEHEARRTIAARFPDWPVGSKKSVTADLLSTIIAEARPHTPKRGHVKDAERRFRDLVGQTEPLIYTANRDGVRIPKPMLDQLAAFRRDLFATYPMALRAVTEGELPSSNGASVPAETPTEPPKAPAEPAGDAMSDYLAWSREVRAMCVRRNADGHALDQWSMRPTLDGLALIGAGIPPAFVRDAATMHFPDDARREVGVPKACDFVRHGIADYLDTASKARIPLMLVGPKGTGKTTHAMGLASRLGLPFGMVSMTAGTSPSAFYGRPKVGGDGGVVESRFVSIYRGGGVFLFDEIDASDPNILLIVNAALANGHFDNPATGECVERHADFIPLSAANTMGLGGGRDYTGRDRLDAATLDRWGAGRIRVELDEDLETRLALAIIAGGK